MMMKTVLGVLSSTCLHPQMVEEDHHLFSIPSFRTNRFSWRLSQTSTFRCRKCHRRTIPACLSGLSQGENGLTNRIQTVGRHIDWSASYRRNEQKFPNNSFICQAKSNESGIDGTFNVRVVPHTLLAAEKEEAKAVLTLFLKKQGSTNALAARIINKSDAFIKHLISRLHSVHKSRYLVGRELTTLEIRDALNPYLESLLDEYGDIFVDVVENFPEPPIIKERSTEKTIAIMNTTSLEEGGTVSPIPPQPSNALNSKKLRAIERVSEVGPSGDLLPHVSYLIELGMDLEMIKEVTRKFPSFAYYSLEGKVKPIVEFLLGLGVPKSDIPYILTRRPQLCGISLSDNLIPTMAYLEDFGVDKKQWAKVIYRFPALLTYSRPKLKATVDFLYEMGLPAEFVGKILTRCPNIISYNVDDKLRPTAEYFKSLGVNVAGILYRAPQTFGLSIESNLKPVTEFFLEKGFSVDDICTMITRYGALYTFSLVENLKPKWEFFETMGYPKSELVKFPQYFGYSLEERIKPRYGIVKESGVNLLLNQVLSLSESEFNKALARKIKKINS
ncbi:transcription termination factor MTERF5, chloroplastic isoform X2 [Impatiens glandulifera]|uniref:transcription termination factor MTERF5, chloroplastic isoform X2 n=1 Tax=Impatiens glandulifera TaxID=253017 RepID=UPI001FB0E78E|nr:transcription termination factor MTERF5, chloroplastic isoform X2 [Impatiens glandulifera]